MALTRKLLKSMGIEDEKIDQIIEAHTEVTDGLKAERDNFKAKAEKLDAVEKELNTLKAAGDGGYKAKYEAEYTAHEALKKQIAEKESKAAKENAVRAYYESKNIKDKNLTIAMRGTNLDAIELGEDGKIKDTKAIDDLVSGDFASLVYTQQTQGANTQNPPGNGGNTALTKEQIMAIKDRTERRKAIAENMNLFEKKE